MRLCDLTPEHKILYAKLVGAQAFLTLIGLLLALWAFASTEWKWYATAYVAVALWFLWHKAALPVIWCWVEGKRELREK